MGLRKLGILALGLFVCGLPTAVGQAADEVKDDPRLVAIGSLAGSHVYTTYGYIGVTADAFGKQVYDADRVEQLMKEVMGLCDANSKLLDKLLEGNIVESDKKAIREIGLIYDGLRMEAAALVQFAKTKDEDDVKSFDAARKAVWPKIQKLLGIKGEEKEEKEDKEDKAEKDDK